MGPIKARLCSECEHCPSVGIDDKSVRIGEGNNLVILSHAEWNDLVAHVLSGELKPVKSAAD